MGISDYCFQVAFGVAPTVDRAWDAVHRAKIGEGNSGDAVRKIIVPSLVMNNDSGIRRSETLSGIERAIREVHAAYRNNVLLLDLDLGPVVEGEREGYDWEEKCLDEDASYMDRLETLRRKCGDDAYQIALSVYQDSSHVDPKTGLLTQLGYVHQKRILLEKISSGDIIIPDHFRPLYVAADLCNMKAGNENIGETDVNPLLDAFGIAFNNSWRSPEILKERGSAREIIELEASRREESSGIYDLSVGRFGSNHVPLRPNGRGGDEGVVYAFFPSNKEMFVNKLLAVQNAIYSSQLDVAAEMFGK